MRFKEDRLIEEWDQLKSKNKLLRNIAMDIDSFCKNNFNQEIIITSIFRTEEEQTKIYGYPKPSVHMYWRGLDFRSWVFTEEEIKKITEYVSSKYGYDKLRPEKKVAFRHKVKDGAEHFHVQTHPKSYKKY